MSESRYCPAAKPPLLEAWLRGHPGIEAVCPDGSATYAEAVRRALPDAVQISKLIKRQMYGHASFPLLRHRILLG